MSSENPSGADNQQETARLRYSSSIRVGRRIRRRRRLLLDVCTPERQRPSTGGWQLHPGFHVYQHERYRAVLEAWSRVRMRAATLEGSEQQVWSDAVDDLVDLDDDVVPFFERYPLVVKADDFRSFAAIVRSMRRKEHLTRDRVRTAPATRLRHELRRQATEQESRRDLGGILRDCTPGTREANASASLREDTVRSSWRHGESGRNDLTTQQHASCMRSNNNA